MTIRATVPPGAFRGPISVTTPLGTACSRAAFLARFGPGQTPQRKAAIPVTS